MAKKPCKLPLPPVAHCAAWVRKGAHAARRRCHKLAHITSAAHEPLHLLYLGAVTIEGHGLYAWAAGGLGAAVLLHIFLKD